MKKTLVAAVLVVLPVVAAVEKPHAGAEVGVRRARITAIDHDSKVPAVTAVTDDGRRLSFEVPRRKDIAGLKVADKVEIVYTEALVISVE